MKKSAKILSLCLAFVLLFSGTSAAYGTEQKTLKNFLDKALLPCGQTLYVWGGGWNEADTGAGVEAVTIGISPKWKRYFLDHAGKYDYRKHRYEIHQGLDCSGFVGWAVYNTMETVSHKEGYVLLSGKMAKDFADRGWGKYIPRQVQAYLPGDIVSLKGHVWISLGQCSDGSIVLLHATPNGRCADFRHSGKKRQ